MKLEAEDISKRFVYDWIIRHFSYDFRSESITGISGINGSGKSTLMRILCGYLSPSSGILNYTYKGSKIPRSSIYKYISFSAPYTDLISEFSLKEMFDFHRRFKAMSSVDNYDSFKSILQLKVDDTLPIQYYSSGMNQKVQLALAILSDTPLLFLDEPTSYLDDANKAWYHNLLDSHISGRTVIIASNEGGDFQLCHEIIYV